MKTDLSKYRNLARYENSDGLGVCVLTTYSVVHGDEACKIASRAVDDIVAAIRIKQAQDDPGRQATRASIKQELASLFPEPIFVEEIPNEYWTGAEAVSRPWLLVTTKIGHIKIGWRKRVILIDWSRTLVQISAANLFPDQPVTKFGHTIHAWDLATAQEYIKRIMEASNAPDE